MNPNNKNKKNIKFKNNLMLLAGVIDKKNYTFLLDTGSERSYMVKKKQLNKYKKKLEYPIKTNGVGGSSIEKYEYRIPTFQLADHQIWQASFILKQKSKLLFKVLRIDGIIGWDILQCFDFQINTIKNSFQIIENKKYITDLIDVGFSKADNHSLPIYYISGKNKEKNFLIDTGSSHSYITSSNLENKSLTKKRTISIGINGIKINKTYFYKNYLFFKSINKKDSILIEEIYLDNNLGSMYAVLGMNTFKNREIYFYNKAGKIVIK